MLGESHCAGLRSGRHRCGRGGPRATSRVDRSRVVHEGAVRVVQVRRILILSSRIPICQLLDQASVARSVGSSDVGDSQRSVSCNGGPLGHRQWVPVRVGRGDKLETLADGAAVVLDGVYPTFQLLSIGVARLRALLLAVVEAHLCIHEGDETVMLLVELQSYCLDLLQQPVAIVGLHFLIIHLACLHLGLHGFTALAPDDGVDGGEVSVQHAAAVDIVLQLLFPNRLVGLIHLKHFSNLDLLRGHRFADRWRRHVDCEQWRGILVVLEVLLGVLLQRFHCLGKLTSVGLLVIALEDIAIHFFSGTFEQ